MANFDEESMKYIFSIYNGGPSSSTNVPSFDMESLAYMSDITKKGNPSVPMKNANQSPEKSEKVLSREVMSSEVISKLESNRICSRYCSGDCHSVWENLQVDKKKRIEDLFTQMTLLEKKNFLLDHLKKQDLLGIKKNGFHFEGHTYCIKSCSIITRVSQYILKQVKEDFKNQLCKYVHGNKYGTRISYSAINFIAWMKHFSSLYGQSSPDELLIVIPSHWTKKSIYDKYISEIVGKPVKMATFYNLMKLKFGPRRLDTSLPWIRISPVSSHSVCDTCTILKQYKRRCTSNEQLLYVQALKYKHTQNYGRARITIANLRQTALSFKSDVMMIQLDDMGHNSTIVPNIVEKSKKLANLEFLPSHVTGTIVWSGFYKEGRRVKFFVNHNQFPQNGDKTVSIIHRLLLDFHEEFGLLPKILVVNCDNCWK